MRVSHLGHLFRLLSGHTQTEQPIHIAEEVMAPQECTLAFPSMSFCLRTMLLVRVSYGAQTVSNPMPLGVSDSRAMVFSSHRTRSHTEHDQSSNHHGSNKLHALQGFFRWDDDSRQAALRSQSLNPMSSCLCMPVMSAAREPPLGLRIRFLPAT